MHTRNFISLAVLLLAGCSKSAPSEPFLVGHLAVTSGPDVVEGTRAEQGIRLAVEEANADPAQHVAGRRVAVLHADTQGKLDNQTCPAQEPVLSVLQEGVSADKRKRQTNRAGEITLSPQNEFPIFVYCPSNITVTATGPSGAAVSFTVTSSGTLAFCCRITVV